LNRNPLAASAAPKAGVQFTGRIPKIHRMLFGVFVKKV
jgi:hypothetical protein